MALGESDIAKFNDLSFTDSGGVYVATLSYNQL